MYTVNNEDYNLLKMISKNEKQSAKNSSKIKFKQGARKSLKILRDNDSRFDLGYYSIIKGILSRTETFMDHQRITKNGEDENVIMDDIIRKKYKKGNEKSNYKYKEYMISYKEA